MTVAENYQSAHRPVPLFPEDLWRAVFSITTTPPNSPCTPPPSPPPAFYVRLPKRTWLPAGFPMNPAMEREAASLSFKDWMRSACFQVTPPLNPSANPSHGLCADVNYRENLIERCSCLSLCFWSQTNTKLLSKWNIHWWKNKEKLNGRLVDLGLKNSQYKNNILGEGRGGEGGSGSTVGHTEQRVGGSNPVAPIVVSFGKTPCMVATNECVNGWMRGHCFTNRGTDHVGA